MNNQTVTKNIQDAETTPWITKTYLQPARTNKPPPNKESPEHKRNQYKLGNHVIGNKYITRIYTTGVN